MLHTECHDRRGSTTVEIMVAMSIVVLFFSGIFTANSHVLSLLRSTVESTASMRTLNGRAEQLRSCTWTQVTDSSYLTGTLLAIPPDANGDLSQLTETVEVIPYLNPGLQAMTVRRLVDGTTEIVLPGDVPALRAQTSLRINLTASWRAPGGRQRLRQLSLIVGQGGITGRR